MDAHLGFYFKSLGEYREGFYKSIAESPAAGHNVLYLGFEKAVDGKAHQGVAETVEGPFVLGEIGGGKAVPHYHVRMAEQDFIRHGSGSIGGVGVVAVNHDVALGVDFPEHAPDHIALALEGFAADDGACPAGQCSGIIGGVVVVNIDGSFGKGVFPVSHYFSYGAAFIVAWDQDCDFI